MNYFVCGTRLLAFNAKCGTSTFAWAILRQFYPEIVKSLEEGTQWAHGGKTENQMLHQFVPKRASPYKMPVAQIFREPVDRFKSAVAFMNLVERAGSVDAIIDDLLNETAAIDGLNQTVAANFHFRPQSRFKGELYYFRMDQIELCADWLGIKVPLKVINRSKRAKPQMTKPQEDLVRDFYHDDVMVWESIK